MKYIHVYSCICYTYHRDGKSSGTRATEEGYE